MKKQTKKPLRVRIETWLTEKKRLAMILIGACLVVLFAVVYWQQDKVKDIAKRQADFEQRQDAEIIKGYIYNEAGQGIKGAIISWEEGIKHTLKYTRSVDSGLFLIGNVIFSPEGLEIVISKPGYYNVRQLVRGMDNQITLKRDPKELTED